MTALNTMAIPELRVPMAGKRDRGYASRLWLRGMRRWEMFKLQLVSVEWPRVIEMLLQKSLPWLFGHDFG